MQWAAGRMAVAAILTVLGAATASAFDLNGTWAGKITCKGTFDGERSTVIATPTLLVDDGGSSLELAVDGVHYSAVPYTDAAHPEKGEIAVIRCDTSSARSGGEFGGEFGRLRVTSKDGKTTGGISGTTFKASVLVARSLYTCHWAFKRVTLDRPALDPCTPGG